MRFASAAIALVVVVLESSAHAEDLEVTEPAGPTAADLASLRAELARQGAAIDELRAARAEEAKARERPAIRFSGYAQVDWVVHNQLSQPELDYSTGLPLNQDRFLLRRGHLRAFAERGLVSAALELDANTVNGPAVRPSCAEVSIGWPEEHRDRTGYASFSLGLMKIPFGFEVPELDQVRPFLERSIVANALYPGTFDLGARLRGGYRFFEAAVALMNGSPIGSKAFPALAPSQTKDAVGRVGMHAEIAPWLRLEAGASADTGMGFHAGTPTTKDVVQWHDDNGDGIVQATEIRVIPGSSATASQQFRRFALGADARVVVRVPVLGDLALRAEIVRGQNLDRGLEYADPVGAGHDLRELGWYVGATQEVTRWATIGVRYDRYDPDQDASQQRALALVPASRSYRTLALMAMLRYETARLVVEMDKRGNPLGRDASGAPTTLASDTVTVRGQVVF